MVVDIPEEIDFANAGKAQFEFAWDIVMSFLTQFDEFVTYVEDDEVEEEYWEAAKQRILTALAIVQQEVELIIKEKIASISP
ncbi:hypothetical protein [Vibrio atlanticus]|uniref:hypothetical protein n=1 Tax=Vibrio atlanticus TaxID=693153 RepID=UPI00354D70C6